MKKTETAHAAPNESRRFTPLFGSDELKLQTTKAVTPFAGMASFFAWLGALEFSKRAAAVMPFEYSSPNAIAPEQTLLAFMSAVVVGASRFAHVGWLRHDKAFHALLGVEKFSWGRCDPEVFPPLHAGENRGVLATALEVDAGFDRGTEGGVLAGLGFDGIFAGGKPRGRLRVTTQRGQDARVTIRSWRCWRRCLLFCTRGCGR